MPRAKRHSQPLPLMTQILPSELAADLLSRGHCVRIKATGQSMRPWIPPGQVVKLVPVHDPSALASGQVVLALCDGRPTLHRIVRTHPELRLKGDALGCLDPAPSEVWGYVEESGGSKDRLIAHLSLALMPLQSVVIRIICLIRSVKYRMKSP